ncbi:MAG: hypothetical protein Q7J13_12850 [Brevundimonas sp.]|uniref:hypothetical protein n=1 Tax=Brevundimonas sp. TaxID=1871086 RepID=UPI0027208D77|nr:hypothetical protein [Brevundimonas sp.]MDO9588807.1 hypothetical protein [Brevundimonas sp.]
MTDQIKFSISIARVDSGGAQLLPTAPDWPTDNLPYDLMPYIEHRPTRLVALRKLVGNCFRTEAGHPDELIDGPGLEALIQHGRDQIRLCGALPPLKTNNAGDRVRRDMDMIVVFRPAAPMLGKAAEVALLAQGIQIGSVVL